MLFYLGRPLAWGAARRQKQAWMCFGEIRSLIRPWIISLWTWSIGVLTIGLRAVILLKISCTINMFMLIVNDCEQNRGREESHGWDSFIVWRPMVVFSNQENGHVIMYMNIEFHELQELPLPHVESQFFQRGSIDQLWFTLSCNSEATNIIFWGTQDAARPVQCHLTHVRMRMLLVNTN